MNVYRGTANVTRAACLAVCLVLAVGWVRAAATEGAGVPEPYEVLVNNVFFDTFITDAIRDISLQTGVPILADATVTGFVTLDLLDVPLPEALRQVAISGGYTVKWMEGYYIIGSATPGSPLYHMLSVTERIKLSHLNAANLPNMLVPAFRDMVRVDPTTNSAIVTGPPETVARIIDDLRKMDVAPYQVRIDALITEVTSQGRANLGLDWSWREQSNEQGIAVQFANLVGSLGYSITGGMDRFLAELRAQVSAGNAKIRANPNLVTVEGKPASLFVGKQNYYRIVSGTSDAQVTRLEPIEAGVTLEITARVSDDGWILLEIAPSVSDVQGNNVGDLPVIGRRRVSTTVRVRDGETIGIGGLLQELEVETTSRVPILGSLPIIGRLFSVERTQVDETEVIILITPAILRDEAAN